jgi:hypothetical protein
VSHSTPLCCRLSHITYYRSLLTLSLFDPPLLLLLLVFRPLNLVITEDGPKVIDFDASARYGQKCYLKFSNAFGSPQLAQKLLAYTQETKNDPIDATAEPCWETWVQEEKNQILASVAVDLWSFGALLVKLSTKDAPSLFLSTEADNIVKPEDLRDLAYSWELRKLDEVGRIATSNEWTPAADLSLWCLQTKPQRRPPTFAAEDEHGNKGVLSHPFFTGRRGELVYLKNGETWAAAQARRVSEMHTAIQTGDSQGLEMILATGGVHISLANNDGSGTMPLASAAFGGDVKIMQLLLAEIDDEWPPDEKAKILDCRAALGLTAYMIACDCGHTEVSKLLETKGCTTDLVNSSGKTGADLLQAFENGREQSVLTPYNHGHRLHRTCKNLESYAQEEKALLKRMLDEDVAAGIKLWHAKQAVYHLGREQMAQLQAAVKNLLPNSFDIALHFTDFRSSNLILSTKGIRASVVGQLGGGVSVCLRSLVDFDWGQDWAEFCLTIGQALWGE